MIGLETWWDQKWKNIYFWSARVTVANWYMTYIWPRLTPWGKGLDFRSRAPCITEASHHMCQIVKALAVINLLPSGTCVFLVVMFSCCQPISVWIIHRMPKITPKGVSLGVSAKPGFGHLVMMLGWLSQLVSSYISMVQNMVNEELQIFLSVVCDFMEVGSFH